MIKNKLYPYIEKYINEYLHGFTSEQLSVGLINGTLDLERLNIRPDRVNEKLDNYEVPVWIKAGLINKIRVSCSLMNFIGEKPLEVSIEEVNLVVTPSFKWILKNIPTYIEEGDNHIREPYDPIDNNSHDIFNKKVNIYDSSVIKEKQKFYEIFTDKTKISEIINKIFTKCLKYYYQKSYLINIQISKVNIKFEDDQLCNYESDIGVGVKINNLYLSLSTEGSTKKNSFKCENLSLYWEPKPKILIPSKTFIDSLDKDNNIKESYYEYLNTVKFNEVAKETVNLIDNFNFMGNLGIQIIESGNLDFFAQNREKFFKFFTQVATSEINLNVYPDLIKLTQRIVDFMKSFYIIEPIQDFKPMRKPYNSLLEAVRRSKNDPNFPKKRKMVVRDWLYYMVWFNRFKKAIYGNAFKNSLHSEYNKYYNICCLPPVISDLNIKPEDVLSNNGSVYTKSQNLNDSLSIRKDRDNSLREIKKTNKEEDLNPENINLVVQSEILVKGINLNIFMKYDSQNRKNNNNLYLCVKLSGLELKNFISKDKFETIFNLKNFIIQSNNNLQIKKALDDKLRTANHTKNIQDTNESLNTINFDHDEFQSSTTFSRKMNDKSQDTYGAKNNYKKQKSIVNILLKDHGDDLNTSIIEEKNQKISLSKVINEYNKSINKQKKASTFHNFLENEINSNHIVKSDEKVNLNILEFGTIPATNKIKENLVINIKFTKMNKNNYENVNINIGSIRINLPTQYISNTIKIFNDYAFLIQKSEDKTKVEQKTETNLVSLKNMLELRELILSKLTKAKPLEILPTNLTTPQHQAEINEYINYLRKSIERFGCQNAPGRWQFNYFFNLLYGKNLEVNLNHSDINVYFYSDDLKLNISKFKFPNLNLKLLINYELQNYLIKFMDVEFSITETDQFKALLNRLFDISEQKFNFTLQLIEPVIQKILDENKLISLIEANNKENVLDSSDNTVKNAVTKKLKENKSVKKKNSEKENTGNTVVQGLKNSVLKNNVYNSNIYINPEKNVPVPSPSITKIERKISSPVNKVKLSPNSFNRNSVESELKKLSSAKKAENIIEIPPINLVNTLILTTDENKPLDRASPPSNILIENSNENISELEDIGFIMEKSITNNNLSKINKTEESFKKVPDVPAAKLEKRTYFTKSKKTVNTFTKYKMK